MRGSREDQSSTMDEASDDEGAARDFGREEAVAQQTEKTWNNPAPEPVFRAPPDPDDDAEARAYAERLNRMRLQLERAAARARASVQTVVQQLEARAPPRAIWTEYFTDEGRPPAWPRGVERDEPSRGRDRADASRTSCTVAPRLWARGSARGGECRGDATAFDLSGSSVETRGRRRRRRGVRATGG